jgi:Spy/CpxP family protein refolding chaperone
MLVQRKTNKPSERKKLMKATKMTLITALAVGSLLTLSPALRADDATNTPPSAPPAGGPPPGGPHGPGMRGRPDFNRIAEQLNLTDDQKPKVKAIFDDQQEQMRGLWQDQDMSREDRMAKMKSIREDTDTKLKAVLTAEQFQKLQEMRPRMGGPRNGPPGGPPPGAPPPDEGGTNAPPAAPPQI